VEKLLGAGILAMVLACGVVGSRLLWLSTRTRQSPELLLGAAFVLLGVIGYPLAIAARGGPGGEPSPGLLLLALGVQNLACLCIYANTWRTFHADRRWPALLCGAVGLGFAASQIGAVASADPDGGPWYYLGFTLRVSGFAWAAWESRRYHDMMQRRLRLGLADPVVADRFRLWSLSTLGIVVGFGIFLVGRLTTENVGTAPFVLAATAVVSLGSALSMWLAFVPPAAYRRRVAARASS